MNSCFHRGIAQELELMLGRRTEVGPQKSTRGGLNGSKLIHDQYITSRGQDKFKHGWLGAVSSGTHPPATA